MYKGQIDLIEADVAEKKQWLRSLDAPGGGDKETRELMRRGRKSQGPTDRV